MDDELKARAETVARLQNSRTRFTPEQITEIGQVHHLLTGRKTECTSCKVYGLLNEINSMLRQGENPIKIMTNAKGQFKPDIDVQLVIRHTQAGIKEITPENLNSSDNFEWALKNFPNLVEAIEGQEDEPVTESEPAQIKTSKKAK